MCYCFNYVSMKCEWQNLILCPISTLALFRSILSQAATVSLSNYATYVISLSKNGKSSSPYDDP